MRILVAEDSALNREVATRLLKAQGHAVVAVENGADAVAAARAEAFDAILMDLEMPEMDGIEATAAIRADEQRTGRHVTIIAMTGHREEEDRARCLAAGMDGHIGKPIRAEALAHALGSGAAEPDWSRAVASLGGDRALFQRIATVFLEETPRLLEDIRAALDAGDADRFRRAAHTLRGSMRYFDAPDALSLAGRLEEAAKEVDSDAAKELLPGLERECARLMESLEEFAGEIG